DKKELLEILENLQKESQTPKSIAEIRKELKAIKNTFKHQLLTAARKALRKTYKENSNSRKELQNWIKTYTEKNQPEYSSHLHSNSEWNAKNIEEVLPTYDEDAEQVDGRIIIRDNFDKIFEKNSKVLIFGEDTGNIGDVNQGLEGLQKKYGKTRISDTGIREATIAGQGIGMALRGLRPIAEIQYLDYILYCLQILSDDLATTHYRTK